VKRLLKRLVYYVLDPILVRRGRGPGIHITFDDGPHPENTPEILDILDRFQCKATFFLVGREAEKHTDLAREILARGHAVGFHSYAHLSSRKCSFREFREDFRKLEDLERDLDTRIRLYRPPYGDLTLKTLCWLALTGRKTVMWSLDSRDSFDEADEIMKTLDPVNIASGEIILFHDDYDRTVELLPSILERLHRGGLSSSAIANG
jgi:peptidoglycan/xylan/chitin deacetylase (PgdA/CDA1 family)